MDSLLFGSEPILQNYSIIKEKGLQVTIFSPEKFIVDILTKRLNLPDSYGQYQGNVVPVISIGSQNVLLGTTDHMQIIVQSINDRVIGQNRYEDTLLGGGYQERIEQIIFSTMQIDIQSRNNEARDNRTLVLAALHSTYCDEQQTAKGCRVFAVPDSFINTGNIQGGSALNRFTIRFKMTYKQVHTLGIDYYDKFYAELNTESSKDMIQYE